MKKREPLDEKYLSEASKKFKLIVTIEEHGLIGGLSSAISEWKALNLFRLRFKAFKNGIVERE